MVWPIFVPAVPVQIPVIPSTANIVLSKGKVLIVPKNNQRALLPANGVCVPLHGVSIFCILMWLCVVKNEDATI